MFLQVGKIGTGKVILFLVIVIILIQIWHMNMLIKQGYNSKDAQETGNSRPRADRMKTELIISKIETAHVLDSSGTYHIITDIFEEGTSNIDLENDITIVSQTSSNHLDDLMDLTERWDGHISIAVFTHKADFERAIGNLLFLHICVPKVRNRVDFHVVFPIGSLLPTSKLKQLLKTETDCNLGIYSSSQMNYDIEGIEYPHNLLRNTAVKFSKTKYVFVIDIDVLPNKHLRADFRKFVVGHTSSKDDRVLFVVPSFEFVTKNITDIPNDKSSLLKQWRLNKIRPFYINVCWKCQKTTDYERWQFLPSSISLELSYFLEWEDPWEPFYIAEKKSIPLYDERFKQYGFNRISQVCEMNIAGYNFGVLNNAFLVHKGFKFADTFHKTKDMENNRNRDLYRQFKGELKTKYPNSNRSC